MDEQTETVNRILENLLRSFVGKKLKQWDLILTQVEFVYSNLIIQVTDKCPFEVVYDTCPFGPLDLTLSSDQR